VIAPPEPPPECRQITGHTGELPGPGLPNSRRAIQTPNCERPSLCPRGMENASSPSQNMDQVIPHWPAARAPWKWKSHGGEERLGGNVPHPPSSCRRFSIGAGRMSPLPVRPAVRPAARPKERRKGGPWQTASVERARTGVSPAIFPTDGDQQPDSPNPREAGLRRSQRAPPHVGRSGTRNLVQTMPIWLHPSRSCPDLENEPQLHPRKAAEEEPRSLSHNRTPEADGRMEKEQGPPTTAIHDRRHDPGRDRIPFDPTGVPG
jgi:hypothetical protein